MLPAVVLWLHAHPGRRGEGDEPGAARPRVHYPCAGFIRHDDTRGGVAGDTGVHVRDDTLVRGLMSSGRFKNPRRKQQVET